MNLRQALEDCSISALARIAQEHSLGLTEPVARGELIAAVEQHLRERLSLPDYLSSLPASEARILAHVASGGGEVRALELERRVLQWAADEQPDESFDVSAPVAGLLHRGLLFRSFVATGPRRGDVYCVPEDLLRFIHGLGSVRSLDQLVEIAEADGPIDTRDPAFDLFLLASALRRRDGLRLDQVDAALVEGSPHPAHPEPVEGRAGPRGDSTTSERPWRFLAVVARQADALAGSGTRVQPAHDIDEFLDNSEDAARRLWEAYLGNGEWNELIESGSTSSAPVGRLRDLSEVRAGVLGLLRPLNPSCWYVLDSAIDAVRRTAPDVLRERYDSAAASLLEPVSGRVLQGAESWAQVEALTMRHLLVGPFHWLGLVRTSQDTLRRQLLTLTEWGAALASGSQLALRPPSEPAWLERDGTFFFPKGGRLGAMFRLEPYVRLVGYGEPMRYLIDAASVCEGLAAGGRMDEMQHALAEVLDAPISDRVKHTLRLWAEEFGQVEIHPAVLLTCENEQLAARVLEEPRLTPFVRERVGPTTARVPVAAVEPLIRQLRALGFIPKVDASLRLMAGRGAYAAQVDEHVLELLLVCLEAVRQLAPVATAELADVGVLRHRLVEALGRERARRLRGTARKLVREARSR